MIVRADTGTLVGDCLVGMMDGATIIVTVGVVVGAVVGVTDS